MFILLANPKQKFAWKFEEGNALIHAPSVIFDPVNTVVVVKTKGKMEVTSNMPSLKEGSVLLPADFADIHNPGYGAHAILEGSGKKSLIRNWVDSRVRLEWMFNSTETGTYKIEALVKTNESNKLDVKVGDKSVSSEIKTTFDKFEIVSFGEIEITKTGDQTISINPNHNIWIGMELIYLELIKK